MAGRQDFEARRKARLARQRRERERRARIMKLALTGIGVLILIILIINIAKCGGKNNTEPVSDNVQATQAVPTPTAEPVVDSSSNIPDPEQGNNDFLSVLKNSGQKNRVYLTFEGDPDSDVTPKILDVLRRYNIKATFFISGDSIESNAYLCTRILEGGHLVEPTSNASASVYDDKNDFIDEIDKTYQLICDNSPTSVKPVKIYRFPSDSGSNHPSFSRELAKAGYYYCDPNMGIGDESSSRDADALYTGFENNRPKLNNLVIQLHNGSSHAATAEVLPRIIQKLLDDGCTFGRLDEVDFSNATEGSSSKQTGSDADDDDDAPTATAAAKTRTAPSSTTAATKAPAKSNSSSQKTTATSAPKENNAAKPAPTEADNSIASE